FFSVLPLALTSPRPPSITLFPTRRSSDLTPRVRSRRGIRSHHSPGRDSIARADRAAHPRRGRPGRRHGAYGWTHRARHVTRECEDRKSTRLNSSHQIISYAVFCLEKKTRE